MVAVPVETSLRAVMIATAKTKVARSVKSEATAMADTIKNNGWCFTVSESLYSYVSTFGFTWGVSSSPHVSAWSSCLDSISKETFTRPTSVSVSITEWYDCAFCGADQL